MDQRGSMPPPDRFLDEMYPHPPPPHRYDERNAPAERNPRGGGGGGGGRRRNDETIGLSLLVRNISSDITSEEIRQAFNRVGQVRDVYMYVNRLCYTHNNVAHGFVLIQHSPCFSHLYHPYRPRDYHSNQPKGFAFVEFANHEQAREARDEMDKFVMKGKMLEVVFAQERRKTPNEMKGRGPDNEYEGSGRGEGHRGRDHEVNNRRDEVNRRDGSRRW